MSANHWSTADWEVLQDTGRPRGHGQRIADCQSLTLEDADTIAVPGASANPVAIANARTAVSFCNQERDRSRAGVGPALRWKEDDRISSAEASSTVRK